MRHFILLGLFISTLFTYAQVSVSTKRAKSITFVDTVLVKDMNNGPMALSSPFRAVDLGDNGYFLSNIYVDGSQQLKFIVMKLNVDGTHQLDTIYGINEPYEYNNLSASAKLGNKSLFVYDNRFKQASVFALDNVSGNFLWSKSYEIDTSINFNPSGVAVNEAANEAVVYGSAYGSYGNSSFAIKIDGNGNEIWTKDIRFPAPDSNGIYIESAVSTDDGGYIFAAGGFTMETFQNFISLIKLDSNGNKVWENSFNLVNQLGNDTLMDFDSKIPKKVITFSDGSASVVSLYQDYQEMSAIVTLNFSQTTGAINHSKKLYLSSGSAQLLNVAKDKEYNGIAINFYDNRDYNNPSDQLAKLDKNGNLRSSYKIIESFKNISTDGSDVLVNTEDNGFLTVKRHIDSLNINRGYFIAKLDKDFYSYCVDTVSGQLSFEDINTYPINMISTINTQNVTVKNNSLLGATSSNILSGITCKCQLSISGNVKDNQNTAIVNTMVYLYKVRASGAFTLFDSSNTTANGEYRFDYLPEQQFIIKASTNIPNTVNTYYGNLNDHSNWDSAWVFNLSCINPRLANKDISLIPTVPQTGSGVVKGYVYELDGFSNSSGKGGSNNFDKAMGDPIPGIDITLNQHPGGTAGSKLTDSRGAYEFTGLNLGSNYTIKADIPGLPNDSVYSIDVQLGKDSFDSLNFYVDSIGIYIYDTSLTGLTVLKYNQLEVELMPNPTKNNVNLLFKEMNNTEVFVKILSNTGAQLVEKKSLINRSNPNMELNIERLANGVYFIQIQFDNNVIVKKIVKQ